MYLLINKSTDKAIGFIISKIEDRILVDIGDMRPKTIWIKFDASIHSIEFKK